MKGIFTGDKVKQAGLSGGVQKVSLVDTLLDEKGIALIIVLWVLAFLMFIVVEFSYTMRVETETVRNLKDETAARYLALAGINMGLAELASEYDIVFMDKDARMRLGKKEKNKITAIDVKREFAMGEGTLTYRVADEEGKLNLNTSSREQIAELLRLTGVERTTRDIIADSILDWRDTNHEFHFNGAEDDYYGSLPGAYGAMDGLFETAEELLLLKGVTPEIFYGTGKVPAEFGLEADSSPDGFESASYEGLAPYMTAKGMGKVNLNTAELLVLEAMLGKGKSMEIALRREIEGYFSWPMYGGAVTSRVFSIHSEGEVHGMRVMIEAIAERTPDKPAARVIYWNDGARALN